MASWSLEVQSPGVTVKSNFTFAQACSIDHELFFFLNPRNRIMLHSLCISSSYPGPGRSHPPDPVLLPLLAHCLADH